MSKELYILALAADIAWSTALEEKFGRKAGDARYDARGISTAELKALRDAKVEADRKLFS